MLRIGGRDFDLMWAVKRAGVLKKMNLHSCSFYRPQNEQDFSHGIVWHHLGEISQVKVEATILFVLTEKMLSLKTSSSFTKMVPDPRNSQIYKTASRDQTADSRAESWISASRSHGWQGPQLPGPGWVPS